MTTVRARSLPLERSPWAGTFLTNGTIFASGIVGGVISARYLGPTGRGQLEALTYWPHFLVGFFGLGLNEAIAIATARKSTRAQVASTVVALSLTLACALGFAMWIALPLLIGRGHAVASNMVLAYAAAFLPASYLAQNLLGVLQGNLQFSKFNRQRTYQALAYPIFLLALLAVGMLNVQTAALGMLVGTVMVAAIRLWQLRYQILNRPSLEDAKFLVRTGLRLHTANITMFLAAQMDFILLLRNSTSKDLGLYVSGLVVGRAIVGMFVQTYTTIRLPQMARMTAKRFMLDVRRQVLVMLILLATCCFVGWPLLPFVLPFIFGKAYLPAVPIAQILLVVCALGGFRKTLIYILRSQRLNRDAVIAESITTLTILAIGYFALLSYGAYGLALAVLVGNFLATIYMSWAFRRILARTPAGEDETPLSVRISS